MKSISLEGVAVIRTLEIGPHQFGRFLCKAVQGIPRPSHLVNKLEKSIVANDETYALAA